MLQKKLDKHGTRCFLVNTGWTGGGYGVGKRMSIKATRACVNAVLDGSINHSKFTTDPVSEDDVEFGVRDRDRVLIHSSRYHCIVGSCLREAVWDFERTGLKSMNNFCDCEMCLNAGRGVAERLQLNRGLIGLE